MYYRFGKAFHFISVFVFLIVFLYSYAALSEQVVFGLDEEGYVTSIISKSLFFYVGVTSFLIINLLFVLPAKMIENGSTINLKRLFPRGTEYWDYMVAWLYSFTGVLNVSMIIMSVMVHSINNQNDVNEGIGGFFFYLIPVLFVMWIIALFWIMLKKFQSMQKA